MSLLSEYEQRTAWKYEPMHGSFHTADGLSAKVNPDGSYAPFLGSTVVFRPGIECMQILHMMKRVLYHKLGDTGMLSAFLPASTVHMTLHDLVCPELCRSDWARQEKYSLEVADSLEQAVKIVEKIRKEYAGQKITLVADRIVNMVSKSLVLLLRPQTEEDYQLLLDLYRRFDCVQNLPYPLTPHITLAYFTPGMLDGDKLQKAVEYAQINPDNAPVFEFDAEGIVVQKFLDMQSYIDIPKRICFCCDGGLNRSVMAANILNHLAKERNLPVYAEARAAFRNTDRVLIREETWTTLEHHGICPDRSHATARYLEDEEVSHFTQFAILSEGARDRIAWLCLPNQDSYMMNGRFLGVRDPEYGEITREQAFQELYQRVEDYLENLNQANG